VLGTETDSIPLRNEVVVLHEVGLRGGRPVDSVLTDRNGVYRLASPTHDTTAGYLVSVEHHGVDYFSEPFVASDQVSVTASMVVVYDTSYTRPDIAVLERHVIIRSPAEDGTRRVLELIGLLNGGFLTRITDDSTRPVWQSAIPSEALQFEVGQSDVSPHTIFRMGDSVAVVAPLSPGSKQILITYLLPKSLDALTIPVDQPVRDMNIMLEDASATIGEGLFKLTGVEELERVSLFRYNAVEVEPGTQITVQFAGTPFAITELWWILVPLVALMLAGVLYWWLKRQPAPVAAAAPADTNAERLAHQIAQMDREFEANRASLSDPERDAYKRRRAELKGRLAEMLAACNKPS
jgi:hypothetical protein